MARETMQKNARGQINIGTSGAIYSQVTEYQVLDTTRRRPHERRGQSHVPLAFVHGR